ncbi:MAG: hypothetical protein PHW31_04395 [Candidatus Pacebacteria bacterium]|nr:hypothetical protein [Candidatus Paceibacterota bacterium]
MLNSSPKHNIFFKWVFWHFVEATRSIFLGWKNFLKFNLNYFSIGLLLKHLLRPWRADKGAYARGFDIKQYFNTFLGNMISRILGAIIRLVVIAAGLVFEIVIFFAGLFVLLFWIFLPVIVILGFFYAIGLVV